ncbi:MAG: hypothetical protein L0G34_09890, partial [Staphylococcus equorum]|nr:hypothetical protein [Staphylococcus equorum]
TTATTSYATRWRWNVYRTIIVHHRAPEIANTNSKRLIDPKRDSISLFYILFEDELLMLQTTLLYKQ